VDLGGVALVAVPVGPLVVADAALEIDLPALVCWRGWSCASAPRAVRSMPG
jgi:hypothetical protein